MQRPRAAQGYTAAVSGLVALVAGACAGERADRSSPPAPPPSAPAVASAPEPSAGDSPAVVAPASRPTDFVDIAQLAPEIALDIRYARADNFAKAVVYPAARCLLRRPVAEALARVQRDLSARGLGLKVWDCYRPISVQQKFWELVPDERYVARPVQRDGVWIEGSKHNRGAAVDLTLISSEGAELPMPTDYDDFSAQAHRDHGGGSAEARANARILEDAMTAHGFTPLPSEWWHFDGPDWQRYDLSDEPLQ